MGVILYYIAVYSLLNLCAHGIDSTFTSEVFPAPVMNLELHRSSNLSAFNAEKRRLSASERDPGLAPLFEGLGTHYSFIYVGSPPQRVSVIVDTGSHHTAFPCVGCKCGKHMDPFFDPANSATAVVKTCGGGICFFRQSYSEGSSWNAFKVKDKVWMGGFQAKDFDASDWSINFEFGCQDSETGLFRTQNVDGIMGMSAADDTLPFQLVAQGITKTRMFALCFKTGGGVLTLGGVDASLHSFSINSSSGSSKEVAKSEPVFAKLTKARGWFTVKLLDMLVRSPKEPTVRKSVGGAQFKYNTGKGTIVDSGTTDTYLPTTLFNSFKTIFNAATGMLYSNKIIDLSAEQFAVLPTVIFVLEGKEDGSKIEIEMPPSSYMEAFKGNRYAARIYFTEASGVVLGANFMNRHNVIFDIDGMRVGFARSDCTYQLKTAGSASVIENSLGGTSDVANTTSSASITVVTSEKPKDKKKGKKKGNISFFN